ncbi:MAG TPA: hypothetical protein VMS60_15730 [Solirubrobacterales bacterium]|nr:hypothetical protein [Solirubrobacterales bacterium]
MTVVDDKGLRFARELRKAIKAREEDADLLAALDVYDRAVTPAERMAAAEYVVRHGIEADNRYLEARGKAFVRMARPDLLPESEQ